MTSTRRTQSGINLVELLVGISIVCISLLLGVPTFQNMRIASDRAAALIELVSAVRLARSEAALRGTAVSLCRSIDGANCADGEDWSIGWIVFHDEDQDGVIEDQAQVIRVARFPNARFTITADSSLRGGITFGTFGFSTPAAGNFAYRDERAARTFSLTYVGRLHITEETTEPST
jgi:type IV fimbrial biogenesis protein FimT